MSNITILGFVVGLVLTLQFSSCQLTLNRRDDSLIYGDAENPCAANMMLYSTGPSSWVCDCLPGYVYFKYRVGCYQPFTQGPCVEGRYVILGRDDVGYCKKNHCTKTGQVSFRGQCAEIGSRGEPCAKNEILYVNETTFELDCFRMGSQSFSIINAPKRQCPKGSRRNAIGICRAEI